MVQSVAVEPTVTESNAPCRRDTMARAVRIFSPAASGTSALQQLFSVPAAWTIDHHAMDDVTARAPRLRSPKQRGIVPTYPRSRQLTDLREGTLILFPNGFVLEPNDRRHPCINVPGASIRGATFFQNAFDVTLSSSERAVIQANSMDRINSIFQAYFWISLS